MYSSPPALPDLHRLRESILNGDRRLVDLQADAATVQHSDACRHVFMPGSLLPAPQTVGDTPNGVLAGLAVSIKDLFDVESQTTRAGSTVLGDAAPAAVDCPAVARLRAAGGWIAGRTNMVEFAFSGVGINPHYGTPVNPADLQVDRIPGGSSSGAAVSVATGAAVIGLGSDTGGSIRIPAALCGIVGFKSTARLVPTSGAVPLSTSLDTVCALTRSVRDAVTAHEILASRRVPLSAKPLAALRLAVATTQMQDSLDSVVSTAFQRGLEALRRAGAQIDDVPLTELGELAGINATGGLSAAESYAWHRQLIGQHEKAYDPRVAMRILRGASMSAADYIDLLAARRDWIQRMDGRLAAYDAVLSPTVPFVAPTLASLRDDNTEFFRVNGLLLRNPSAVNMLDGCAISLPCHAPGELPVGLMVWHGALHDDAVLGAALLIEAVLQNSH